MYSTLLRQLKLKWMASRAYTPPFEGCSVRDIDEIKMRQGVKQLPTLYREFMMELGRKAGGLETVVSGAFLYPHVLDFKEAGYPSITILDEDLKLPDDIFVFLTDYDAYALYFQTDVEEDDPVVYRIAEDLSKVENGNIKERPEVYFGHLSEFLIEMIESALEHSGTKEPEE